VGKRSLIRFREKGGKEKEIPVHHKLEEYLDVYLEAAKLSEQPASLLFRSTRGRSRELGTDGLTRKDAWAMLKRRLRDAGLSTIYSNHSFRTAGITNYLENDGTLEVAQRIAGHADSRTTKLYDRRGQKVLLEEYGTDSILITPEPRTPKVFVSYAQTEERYRMDFVELANA
jgi:site-specific recombinase XerD